MTKSDVTSHFVVEDIATVYDNNKGQDEMRPISICLIRVYVAPGKFIKSSHVRPFVFVREDTTRGSGEGLAFATVVVNWQQNGKNEAGKWREDFDEHSKVPKKEVCI